MSSLEPPILDAVRKRLPLFAAAFALIVTACDERSTKPVDQPPLSDRMADFSLTDVNPNSPTGGRAVSPRHLLGKVSAWYFGHST